MYTSPLHQEVYKFSKTHLDPRCHSLENLGAEQIGTEVFSVPFFTQNFCNMLLEEVKHFQVKRRNASNSIHIFQLLAALFLLFWKTLVKILQGFKDDTSKCEHRFKAWGKKPLYKANLDQGLVLNILQVFFKSRRRNSVSKKMLMFLSFLVLLYASGHFKQKENS